MQTTATPPLAWGHVSRKILNIVSLTIFRDHELFTLFSPHISIHSPFFWIISCIQTDSVITLLKMKQGFLRNISLPRQRSFFYFTVKILEILFQEFSVHFHSSAPPSRSPCLQRIALDRVTDETHLHTNGEAVCG